MRHRSEQKEWHSTPITLLDSATFVSGQRLLMSRTLECSDLAELSFSLRLEENGVLVKRVNF